MLTAQLYGKTISGKTIAEIKRKASRIANGFQNAFDCMKVTDQEIGLECTFGDTTEKPKQYHSFWKVAVKECGK